VPKYISPNIFYKIFFYISAHTWVSGKIENTEIACKIRILRIRAENVCCVWLKVMEELAVWWLTKNNQIKSKIKQLPRKGEVTREVKKKRKKRNKENKIKEDEGKGEYLVAFVCVELNEDSNKI
jgi:hypothetical protein